MTDNTAEATAAAEESAAATAARVTTEAVETEETEVASATLMTAEQVAERLDISTRRLRDWRKEGRIAEVGRFKRGTARIPLFDPADVARLMAAEEASATTAAPVTAVATVTTAADRQAFNDAVAKAVAAEVRLVLAERAEAPEAVEAAVAPLVELVREQQSTIDELRQETEKADKRARDAEARVVAYEARHQQRIAAAAEAIRKRNTSQNLRPSGSLMPSKVEWEADLHEAGEALDLSEQPLPHVQPSQQERSLWRRFLDRLGGD